MSTNLVGRVFGDRYELTQRIAEGGMAGVYRATDQRLHHNVAVKVLHERLRLEPGIAERFRQEALTAAQLNHPHIVRVTDQGTDALTGLPYLVMEFIEGNTLRTVLNHQRKLPTPTALVFAASIVSGLAASHAAGLVHRDMKPENVLVSRDGIIKVTDFGLSRPATQHTSADILVGTVAYVSPELVTGKQADERSDIYAVGIMLFEMLTGRQPFTGDSIQVAYKHAHDRVPDPRELDPDVDPDLAELVLDCTEPDPAERPANALILAQRIGRLRRKLKATTQPTGQPTEDLSKLTEPHADAWPGQGGSAPTDAFDYASEGDNDGEPRNPLDPTRAFTTALPQAAHSELAATVTYPEPPMPAHPPIAGSPDRTTSPAPAALTMAQRRQARRPQITLRQSRPVFTLVRWALWLGGIGALSWAGYAAAEWLLTGTY